MPWLRIQAARSSSWGGDFGRSRVAHKEVIKAEDTTSFNHAPPVLTEDRGGRGAARNPCPSFIAVVDFVFFIFLATLLHHNTKLDGWEKFPVGRHHTLVSDEQSDELHIPSGLINHTKPKCVFSTAVGFFFFFLTTVGGWSLNWSPL